MLEAPPTYWNSAVVDRIQRDAEVDREAATELWAEMLLFVDMVAVSKEFVSPPPKVDIAWHAFILHTRDYEAYCRERFGRIIHHQPTGKPDPEAYRRAYEARAASGRPVDNGIWPVPVSPWASDGGGHGGDDGPGQSGDFASGAAALGGGAVAAEGGAIPGGDFGNHSGGASGDFAPGGESGRSDAGGGASGGDFGGSGASGGDSGGGSGGGDSSGGASCGGGSSCGGGGCGGGGG